MSFSMDIKIVCRKCKLPQAEVEFYTNRTAGKEYRKNICRTCDNGTRKFHRQSSWADRCARDPNHKEKRYAYTRRRRHDPKFLPTIILQDTRSTDKKYLRENDLDRDWIERIIANGCLYCGETRLRMTLDRIDNGLGHLKANVTPSCIRCNYLRRDMPYEAWLIVAEGVRKARTVGAFADWVGGTTNRYAGEPEVQFAG